MITPSSYNLCTHTHPKHSHFDCSQAFVLMRREQGTRLVRQCRGWRRKMRREGGEEKIVQGSQGEEYPKTASTYAKALPKEVAAMGGGKRRGGCIFMRKVHHLSQKAWEHRTPGATTSATESLGLHRRITAAVAPRVEPRGRCIPGGLYKCRANIVVPQATSKSIVNVTENDAIVYSSPKAKVTRRVHHNIFFVTHF